MNTDHYTCLASAPRDCGTAANLHSQARCGIFPAFLAPLRTYILILFCSWRKRRAHGLHMSSLFLYTVLIWLSPTLLVRKFRRWVQTSRMCWRFSESALIGKRSLPNVALNARIPHSADWRSLGSNLCSIISIAESYSLLASSLVTTSHLSFVLRALMHLSSTSSPAANALSHSTANPFGVRVSSDRSGSTDPEHRATF